MKRALIKSYDIAENDKGELLFSIPDLGAEAAGAVFSFDGNDLMIRYPDERAARLPNIPTATAPVLHHSKKILIIETSPDAIVRSYEAKNLKRVPVKKARKRL